MTAFNPKQNQLSPQEWQSVAAEAIENDNSQYIIIVGIIGGLFAASVTGFPPTGLLVAGWSMQVAWKKTQDINRNEVAINQYGCIAHTLKGDKLRQFRNQVGDEEVIKQVVWARENGYPTDDILEDSCSPDYTFAPHEEYLVDGELIRKLQNHINKIVEEGDK